MTKEALKTKLFPQILDCYSKVLSMAPAELQDFAVKALRFGMTISGYEIYLDDDMLKEYKHAYGEEINLWFEAATREIAQNLAKIFNGRLEEK